MSEVDAIAADERRRRGEARLAASRPSREAAAAAHARTIASVNQGDEALLRKSLAEIAANPTRMTEAERARLLALTEEKIEAAALAVSDNPPWTDAELEQAVRERDARQTVEKQTA